MPKPAVDYIETIQPYNRLGSADPLWQLNELWNVDKHRTLIAIPNASWNQSVVIATPGGRETYPGEVKDAIPPEVVRLDANSDASVILGEPGKVRIIFGSDVPSVAKKMVVPTLRWMLNDVQGVILPGVEQFL